MRELIEMLSYCRPAWSATEEEFIGRFIDPLGAEQDGYGNRIIRVGDRPNVMWSSHTDTVHSREGRVPIHIDGNVARVSPWSKASCLGADCTTGVWLMMEMVRAKVPGLYVFHRAEEIGCLGSEHILYETPDLLADIDACIAFDRYGTRSIVSHQMMERGCSLDFTQSVVKQLPGFKADPNGSFTDSFTYFGLVSECTNLSVGYDHQHTRRETQNLSFAEQMRDWMVSFDTTSLVFERVPESSSWAYPEVRAPKQDLAYLVKNFPNEVADFLELYGFDPDHIWDHIWDAYNYAKAS